MDGYADIVIPGEHIAMVAKETNAHLIAAAPDLYAALDPVELRMVAALIGETYPKAARTLREIGDKQSAALTAAAPDLYSRAILAARKEENRDLKPKKKTARDEVVDVLSSFGPSAYLPNGKLNTALVEAIIAMIGKEPRDD
jgi:hypothetical protein